MLVISLTVIAFVISPRIHDMHDISYSVQMALTDSAYYNPIRVLNLLQQLPTTYFSLSILHSPSPRDPPACLQLHDTLRCPPDLTRTCCDCGDSSPLDRHHHETKYL